MSTILIGHKNPDTDSICSSLAYADFRREIYGEKDIIPARCGNINPQTKFVLERFHIDPPNFIPDLYIRAKDIMTKEVISLSPGEPLRRAVEIFKNDGLHLVPIFTDDSIKKVQGVLSFACLARHILHYENQSDSLPVSINALVRGINAQLLVGVNSNEVFPARFMIGGMEAGAFTHHVLKTKETCLPIIIVGDRYNIQRLAIDLKAFAVIVTGGLPVRDDILKLAEDNNVYILLSPYDTATTAYLARLAIPVGMVAEEVHEFLNPEDKSVEIKEKIIQAENRGLVVLDEEKNFQGVITRTDLLKNQRKRVILLDHNEKSQAIDGIEEAELVEIIDHHRLGDIQTVRPVRFINEPVGSTCTIIARFFKSIQKNPAPNIAGLLISGILSDTMLFKSPTTTHEDKEMADWLGKTANIDVLQFGSDLFTAGSSISLLSVKEIINNDFKVYEGKPGKFGVGQIEVIGNSLLIDLKDKLVEELQTLADNYGYLLSILMVSDVVEGGSHILCAGKEYLADYFGYEKIEPNVYYAKGLLSRKKQLIPHILEALAT
ncbi:MAG: putative manganese-dependent inorganic diphosphatase [bacterium]